MYKNCIPFLSIIVAAALAIAQSVAAQTVPVYSVANPPTVDGDDSDWGNMPATIVPLKKTKPDGVVETRSVSIRGGTHGDRVFLFVEWDDESEDTIHKPWIWNSEQKKYIEGPQREDRLAVQFSTDASYSTNWRLGREFTADTWHWKASRSNPLGLAHDKSLVISQSKLLRAYKMETANGGSVYISRPSDAGDKIYSTTRYRRFDQPLMPKYRLTGSPQGSVADVTARGVWSQGRWRLELSRKLLTGNADDIVLPQRPGSIAGGIAVFDHSENDDHAISDTLTFDFTHQPWRAN